jgi:hypothetical protein
VGRLRLASLLGAGALSLGVLLHGLQAATGVSDIPGAAGFVPAGVSTGAFLVRGAQWVLLGAAAITAAAALSPLRDSGKTLGEPSSQALRAGVGLLSAAGAVGALGTVAAWLYFSSAQQSLPGMGLGSDPGLTRLFEQYRIAFAASAAAGLVASFALVAGLERIWGRLLRGPARANFAAFARLFTAGAAANLGLVLVVFFGVMTAARLDAPPANPWAQGLLAMGPALALASLPYLRRSLADVEGRAKELSKAAAPAKA